VEKVKKYKQAKGVGDKQEKQSREIVNNNSSEN
jgi:hypothetical protein